MFGLFKKKKLPELGKGVYVVFKHCHQRYYGHVQEVNEDGTYTVRSYKSKVVFFVNRTASELEVSKDLN